MTDLALKTCCRCHEEKPADFGHFYRWDRAPDGLRPECIQCNRVYFAAWRRNKKTEIQQWLVEYKSKPCMDCGGTFPTYVMDFDHRRGEKVKSVSALLASTLNRAKVEAEVAKCDLVCSNCHRVRNHKDGWVARV